MKYFILKSGRKYETMEATQMRDKIIHNIFLLDKTTWNCMLHGHIE